MTRVLRAGRLAAGVLVALAAGGLVPQTASACSLTRLEPLGTPEDLATADVVFTGTVVQRDEPFSMGLESSIDPIGWTFVVDGVEKGAAVDRIRVESARHSASCGFEFRLGQRYRVFADQSGWFSLSTGLGDVSSLDPLPNPPSTEPGGINFLVWQTITAAVAAAVVVVPVGGAVWGRAVQRRRGRRI